MFIMKYIYIINFLFVYNYLFLNEEFIICLSLISVFCFLSFMLKKAFLYIFFFNFDKVYYYFFVLNYVHLYFFFYLVSLYTYVYVFLLFNIENLFYILNNFIFIKKIKETLILKYKTIFWAFVFYFRSIFFFFNNLKNFYIKIFNNELLLSKTYKLFFSYFKSNLKFNYLYFIC